LLRQQNLGSLFEVDNAFCSKSLISIFLFHSAYSEQKMDGNVNTKLKG
jgi:hypothetical protein